MKLVDLSQEIIHKDKFGQHAAHPSPLIFTYVSHEESRQQLAGGVTKDYSYTSEWINLSSHAGTHLDAQWHTNSDPQSMTIDQIPLEWCYGDAVCLDLSHKAPQSWIDPEDLESACDSAKIMVQPGDILLLYTGHWNRSKGKPSYSSDNPGLSQAGVRWIFEKRVKLFGIDAVAPDNPVDQTERKFFPAHDLLRDFGIPHLENLANLDKVSGKRFVFMGFPIKLRGASAGWVRAVALLNE
ncbi:MAG: cyclase family protein [Nitrososphaerales archaeon]